MRDLTELLRVDPNIDKPDSVDDAVVFIEEGLRSVVADDETAKAVLVRLGLSPDEADDQIKVSYGPMA